ncbi:hypothetical protein [Sphaerisporangium corydalis]|uniref:TetR family transcriptional regulator n=1 Tax=Sphaerisporangium corydalis TaxID=1441875 RepID=A0ABV9E937_9ACTN|nr:hypothetical protein [Sphaerisporangium corydalis]
MVDSWRGLPRPARVVAEAADEAVAAALSRDPEAYRLAAARLAGLGSEHVGLVLGTVVRSLLEDAHPDGLTVDDVQAVVGRCARAAFAWFPDVDADVLVMLVAGALGVHQAEPDFQLDGKDVTRQAPLLIADLLAASGQRFDRRLSAAFADLARSQSAEMP